jgi:hypothetical protein
MTQNTESPETPGRFTWSTLRIEFSAPRSSVNSQVKLRILYSSHTLSPVTLRPPLDLRYCSTHGLTTPGTPRR